MISQSPRVLISHENCIVTLNPLLAECVKVWSFLHVFHNKQFAIYIIKFHKFTKINFCGGEAIFIQYTFTYMYTNRDRKER